MRYRDIKSKSINRIINFRNIIVYNSGKFMI